jgi:phage tail sheath protein FI
MPEYLSPGVYVEEISVGPKPIEGVSTSTAAFIGPTERGPEYAQLVTSWLDFERWFGGKILPGMATTYMSYAVQGFFDNGGQRCFIARVVNTAAIPGTGAIGAFTAQVIGRGSWATRILFKVEPPSKIVEGDDTRFKLTLMYFSETPPGFPSIVDPTLTTPEALSNRDRRTPDVLEVYDNVTFESGRSNSVETLVNSTSHLVRMAVTAGAERSRPPDATTPTPLIAAADDGGDIDLADYQGTNDPPALPNDDGLARRRGLRAIAEVDEVSLVVAPDETLVSDLPQQVIIQCETLKDRFAILTFPQATTNHAGMNPPQDSTYGAVYYPWIKIYDANRREEVLIPPTGHVTGIIARTDIERGVHKAPANEVVRGARDLEFPVPKGVQDILNPNGINCIRDFRKDGRGIRLWGARTMSSDPEWRYVNVRRLFLYLEESIDEATQWVVFEPNDEPLWARVRQSIEAFLLRVWRNGALMGATQAEAFFVLCDRTTMTQDDIDNGRLICLIGLAPVKPAEFVIFRFFQKTAEATA